MIGPVLIGGVLDVHLARACSCCRFLFLFELTHIGSTEQSIVDCPVVCLCQHFHILTLLIVTNILYFQCLKLNSDTLTYDVAAYNTELMLLWPIHCLVFSCKVTGTYINKEHTVAEHCSLNNCCLIILITEASLLFFKSW